MNIRDELTFLNEVKRALMIPSSDSYADDEIKLHIEACSELLVSKGVSRNTVRSTNPLVEGLILIYVKTFFGFKNDGSVKELPSSFDLLTRQLVMGGSD